MSKTALYFFTCLLLCWNTHALSQYYFYNSRYYDALFTVDIGISAGAMNCLTDLGGRNETGKRFISDINRSATHACGGLFAGINYNNAIGIRIELAAGQVSACDSILKQYTSAGNGRYIRNLSFRSAIKELSLAAELYPLSLFHDANFALMPYVVAGIGSFSFNPQAQYNSSQVSLPLLHTEGEGMKEYPDRPIYKLTQLNVPLGGGVKYEITPFLNLRCELIYRQLFTDYLDDVSATYVNSSVFGRNLPPQVAFLAQKMADRRQKSLYSYNEHEGEIRGNKTNNDAYFSINIKFSLALGRTKIR